VPFSEKHNPLRHPPRAVDKVGMGVRPIYTYPLHIEVDLWSLTLSEERRLRVFENMVLKGVFGPKRDELMGNGQSSITKS
jgi:hypothetical protein